MCISQKQDRNPSLFHYADVSDDSGSTSLACYDFTIPSNSSSLITFTPSYSAFASLLPAFSPATR